MLCPKSGYPSTLPPVILDSSPSSSSSCGTFASFRTPGMVCSARCLSTSSYSVVFADVQELARSLTNVVKLYVQHAPIVSTCHGPSSLKKMGWVLTSRLSIPSGPDWLTRYRSNIPAVPDPVHHLTIQLLGLLPSDDQSWTYWLNL